MTGLLNLTFVLKMDYYSYFFNYFSLPTIASPWGCSLQNSSSVGEIPWYSRPPQAIRSLRTVDSGAPESE